MNVINTTMRTGPHTDIAWRRLTMTTRVTRPSHSTVAKGGHDIPDAAVARPVLVR